MVKAYGLIIYAMSHLKTKMRSKSEMEMKVESYDSVSAEAIPL